ncbi:glycerophosphodiester phosphodiesterase 1-like [Asterias rubens]|uniref:glycerophosphodiester phosphodiesterase 1-like n=1 Tax=Asterias rubens TaxID=7604 RepID=UPI0014557532|nr:glycerophosphodiester phosphodiesterase 1-like [Asterias rubens]
MAMLTLHIVLTSIFHLFTAFSLIFCPLYIALGWLFSVEYCFYAAITVLAGALLALLVFRIRRTDKQQLETFKGSGWPSSNIAHRGGAIEAPENTLVAFKEASKNGSKFVEMDLEMTKDGIPVILHDATLDRTTDGMGPIKNYTLAEVVKLNAAAKHPLRDQFAHATIPTLEEATVECLGLGLKIFFDVKDWSDKMVNTLVDLYRRHPALYERAMVCSFFPPLIYKLRRKDSTILTGLTSSHNFLENNFTTETDPFWKRCLAAAGDYVLMWSHEAWLWLLCGNAAVLLNKKSVHQATVDYWNQRGIQTVVWTVNEPVEKEYFHKSLECGVISDSVLATKT